MNKEETEYTKEEIFEKRKKFFSSSVSVSYENSDPLMIMGGSKSRLIDEHGNVYLDTRNNVCHVGHQNEAVVAAVQKQVGILNTNTRYLHPNAALLAERLVSLLPDRLCKVFFVNSGSEANDLALRLAQAKTKSNNMIVQDTGYHGHTLSTLAVSPYKYKSKEFNMPFNNCVGKNVIKVPCPDTFRGIHTGDDAASKYANYVVEACNTYKQRGEDVCAFITEGGLSVGGVILPPPMYFKKCVDAVRAAGGLYIADEVQTALGRLGDDCFWAFLHGGNDIVPDIVTLGKPFGNGMPLAAVITTEEVSSAFESMGVEYFNTFAGSPVCCAAGLAVLDELERNKLPAHAARVGNYLKSKFLSLDLSDCPDINIGDVRGRGLFMGIDIVKNDMKPGTLETSFICTKLKEDFRILTSIDGPHDNVLVVKPPLVFSMADADEFIDAFKKAAHMIAKIDKSTISKTPT